MSQILFNSQLNSWPKMTLIRGLVCLWFTFEFTAENGIDWVTSQSSIHGRIRGRSGLHSGAKSVFNSRKNSRPIGCQVSLRFTDEFTANWVTSLYLVHGTKMAIVFFKMEKSFPQNSLEKKSQNCKDWELTFGLQLCTLASSKWPLIWNQIVFFPCGSQFHLWNNCLCWRKEEFRLNDPWVLLSNLDSSLVP